VTQPTVQTLIQPMIHNPNIPVKHPPNLWLAGRDEDNLLSYHLQTS